MSLTPKKTASFKETKIKPLDLPDAFSSVSQTQTKTILRTRFS